MNSNIQQTFIVLENKYLSKYINRESSVLKESITLFSLTSEIKFLLCEIL